MIWISPLLAIRSLKIAGGRSVLDRGSPASSEECVEQCPGVLQVSRVKSLGEPVVDRRQQLPRLGPLPLALPQSRQAHSRTQLPRSGLLAASNSQGLLEAGFGRWRLRDGLA